MPYYNTFHKIYTGLFDIKTDVALTVNREVDPEKMKAKFEKADFLYIGGGDTVYMLRQWKQSGLLPLIQTAFEEGKLIARAFGGRHLLVRGDVFRFRRRRGVSHFPRTWLDKRQNFSALRRKNA